MPLAGALLAFENGDFLLVCGDKQAHAYFAHPKLAHTATSFARGLNEGDALLAGIQKLNPAHFTYIRLTHTINFIKPTCYSKYAL